MASAGDGSVVVESLFLVAHIVGVLHKVLVLFCSTVSFLVLQSTC